MTAKRAKENEVSSWAIALLSCSFDLVAIGERLAGLNQRRAARSVAVLARRAGILARELMKESMTK